MIIGHFAVTPLTVASHFVIHPTERHTPQSIDALLPRLSGMPDVFFLRRVDCGLTGRVTLATAESDLAVVMA